MKVSGCILIFSKATKIRQYSNSAAILYYLVFWQNSNPWNTSISFSKVWVLCCVCSCRHVIWKWLNLPSAFQNLKMFKETFYLFEVGYIYELQACEWNNMISFFCHILPLCTPVHCSETLQSCCVHILPFCQHWNYGRKMYIKNNIICNKWVKVKINQSINRFVIVVRMLSCKLVSRYKKKVVIILWSNNMIKTGAHYIKTITIVFCQIWQTRA